MATRRFQLTRSFWLRLFAVILFVALGTFAVIHSMHKKSVAQNQTNESAESESDAENSGDDGNSDTELNQEDPKNSEPALPSNSGGLNRELVNSDLGGAGTNRNSFYAAQADNKKKKAANSTVSAPVVQASANQGNGGFNPGANLRNTQNNARDSLNRFGNQLNQAAESTSDNLRNPLVPPPLQPRNKNKKNANNPANITASVGGNRDNPAIERSQSNTSTLPNNIPPIVVRGEIENQNRNDAAGNNSTGSNARNLQSDRNNSRFGQNSGNQFNTTPSQSSTQQPPALRGNLQSTESQPARVDTQGTSNSFGDSAQTPIRSDNRFGNTDNRNNNNRLPGRLGNNSTDLNAQTDQPESSQNNPRSGSNLRQNTQQQNGTRQSGTQQNGQPLNRNRNNLNQGATVNSGLPVRQPDRQNAPVQNASSIVDKNTPGLSINEGAQAPTILIEKRAPAEIQVNREAVFELIVKNSGRVPANQVQVFDHVPQGTRLVSAEPEPQTTRGSQLNWNLGKLDPGQEKRIQIKLLPMQPGEVGSVAQVTFSAAASVRTICTKPELELKANAPDTVLIGQDVVVDINVTNKGNGAAESVVIQEDVPEGLEFAGGVRELEYPLGNLRPGESKRIQLRLRAAKVGTVKNLMVAHAKGELRATDSVDVKIVAPKLETDGQGPTRRFVNREATHQFTVSNVGTARSTNLEMVAKLPRGLKFKNTNNMGQYFPQNHSVVWSLAELQAGQMGRIELTTVPVETGEQPIDFSVKADLNQSGQTRQTLKVEQIVEVFLDIDDLNEAIEVGSPTSYEVKIRNQGSTVATNVQLQVEFPAAIRPVRVQNGRGGEIRGQQVVFPIIPRLNSNQELRYVIDATGLREGDHLVVASLKTSDREAPISKQESTRVYLDR